MDAKLLSEILELHGKWLRSIDGGKRADLTGANLYGAYLYGADLTGANLYGANLTAADLSGANLTRAYLYGADLTGANLYGAYLYGADLTGADAKKLTLVGDRPLFQLGPIGSRIDNLLAFLTDDGIYLRAGCWFGPLKEFVARVKERHGTTQHGREYMAAIGLVKMHAKIWTPKKGE
jgi:hypothetical protein